MPRDTPRFSSHTRNGCTQMVSTTPRKNGAKIPAIAARPKAAIVAPPSPIRMKALRCALGGSTGVTTTAESPPGAASLDRFLFHHMMSPISVRAFRRLVMPPLAAP